MDVRIDPHVGDDGAQHDEGDQRRRAHLQDEAGDDSVDRRYVRVAEQRLVGLDRGVQISRHRLIELEGDITGGEEQREAGAKRRRAGDRLEDDRHKQDMGGRIEQRPDITAGLGAEARRHFANEKGADDTEMGGEIAHVNHPNG